MDALWRSSEVSLKESLAEELIAHEAELAEDFYGRIVMRNCNLSHYRRKQAMWQEKTVTAANARELFHDILEDKLTDSQAVNAPSLKKKRKSKTLSEDGLPDPSSRTKKKKPNQ